ncbi:MAG: hypothetical protein LBP89_01965, partial [Helicobacteraceae bacterium]|nr:hypothetical protein [Helicobacteraceae bacterium]
MLLLFIKTLQNRKSSQDLEAFIYDRHTIWFGNDALRNKYYWHRWSYLNFLEWWGNILFGYLYFLIMQNTSIVFWIILSALVTYFIALDKETRSAAKRSLWQTIKRILRP